MAIFFLVELIYNLIIPVWVHINVLNQRYSNHIMYRTEAYL